MARKKGEIEGELKQLRAEREEMNRRIDRAEQELSSVLALEEEAQTKFVSGKVKEFQKQRDGAGSPFDAAGGQR